jgi:hypothetical protein
MKGTRSFRSPIALTAFVGTLALAWVLPASSNGATLVQVRRQLLAWHLRPAALFPSQLPPSFRGASVTLYRFSGVDFDVELAKPDYSGTNFCVDFRRGNAALLNAALHDRGNISVRRVRIGTRSVWFLVTEHSAAPTLLAWHEQGRLYLLSPYRCLLVDSSAAAASGCRRDFIEA